MPYTYDTLTADVIANMEEDSSEFVSALPTIVERAQSYLQKRIDPVELLAITTVSCSAGDRTLSLPSNLYVLKSAQISGASGWTNLIQQTAEYLTEYWPIYTSVGQPKYYAAVNNSVVLLAPTPVSTQSVVLEFIPRVSALSAGDLQNWYGTYAEDALFAACMHYANLWSKNSRAAADWKNRADEECQAINNTARRARRSDVSDRSGGPPENNIGEGAT